MEYHNHGLPGWKEPQGWSAGNKFCKQGMKKKKGN